MARLYSNENIPRQVVAELRRLGHDVLTSPEAGTANAAVPDSEVLAFAVAENRILLSAQSPALPGPPSAPDPRPRGNHPLHVRPGFLRTGRRIHDAVAAASDMRSQLIASTGPPEEAAGSSSRSRLAPCVRAVTARRGGWA